AARPDAVTLVPREDDAYTVPELEPPAHAGAAFDRIELADAEEEVLAPRRTRAWAIAAIAVALTAAGLAVALWPRGEPIDAAAVDAAVGGAAIDAAAAPPDAAPPPPPTDAAPRRAAPPPPGPRWPRRDYRVVVVTEPRGARLYAPDGTYAGTDGTTLRRRAGTRLRLECRKPGYRSCTALLVFDRERRS